MDFQVC